MYGEPELTIISLGGGVQSSVMALMAAEGLIKPMPDFAVFADTGWEPQGVYQHLNWLEKQIPFPIQRVSSGNIRSDILAGTNSTGQQFTSIPAFVSSASGKTSIIKRQCTREYKLSPIETELRDLLGLGYRQAVPKGLCVELWIGISRDEIIRMKPGRLPWIHHYWPLIDLKMTRSDCKAWFQERYPDRVLPRSACIGCPYHTNSEWMEMQQSDPESWADAVFVDAALRSTARAERFGVEMYLHSSRIPLAEIDFFPSEHQLNLFGDECEGLCGV